MLKNLNGTFYGCHDQVHRQCFILSFIASDEAIQQGKQFLEWH